MAVYYTMYKDRPAVAVKSDKLCALFLPLDGGKMVSLKTSSGHELLVQALGASYRVLTPNGSYVDAECSGFDDMFPTIDPCILEEGEYAGVLYPDHGEVCRMPMQFEIKNDSVRLAFSSSLFPYNFEKQISPEPDGSIAIKYRIRNHGISPLPYIWAAHCMLAGENDMQIITPFESHAPIRMMFGPEHSDKLSLDQLSGFSDDGNTYKFYYLKAITNGYCGCRYPSLREELLLQYDKNKIPYLGVWLNNGGFKGLYNIALEPCTAPFDRPDTAKEAGCESVIPGDSLLEFTLSLYWHKY